MALDFSAGTTSVSNHGSASSVDDVNVGTICSWINITINTDTDCLILGKAIATMRFAFNAAGALAFFRDNPGGGANDLLVNAALTNFSAYGLNKWLFAAVVYDATSGVDADQRLYMGDEFTPPAEPSSYTTQRGGSGSPNTDAANDATVGGTGSQWNMQDYIGAVHWLSSQLSVAQLYQQWRRFRPVGGVDTVLLCHYGIHGSGGTGTQRDWSGYGNDGTVTAVSKAAHPAIAIFPMGQIWKPTPAAGGLSATVNQVTETDLAQAAGRLKTKALTQITESDLAQALTSAKTMAVAQSTESDLAQAMTSLKTLALAQVTEADLAQSVSWNPKHRLISQALETDTVQAITRLKTLSVVQITETDLAQAVTRLKTLALGLVIETDLAQPISAGGEIIVAVNQVLETDLAQLVGRLKTLALAQTTEADLAQAVARLKTLALGLVSEADLAQSVGRSKAAAIAQIAETDLAQALGTAKALALLQVTETDLAQSVAWAPKHRLVGQVAEVDTAQSITLGAIILVAAFGTVFRPNRVGTVFRPNRTGSVFRPNRSGNTVVSDREG